MSNEKKRVLTGDRPTGLLHLGHFVGSIQNRLVMQEKFECYFIIADLHTLTTKPQKSDIYKLREFTHQMVLDYLACGIDPKKCVLFLPTTRFGGLIAYSNRRVNNTNRRT